jgi:hypothetical protein
MEEVRGRAASRGVAEAFLRFACLKVPSHLRFCSLRPAPLIPPFSPRRGGRRSRLRQPANLRSTTKCNLFTRSFAGTMERVGSWSTPTGNRSNKVASEWAGLLESERSCSAGGDRQPWSCWLNRRWTMRLLYGLRQAGIRSRDIDHHRDRFERLGYGGYVIVPL